MAFDTLRARRRHNPLLRRSDVVGSWTALLLSAGLVLGAPAAGTASGWSAFAQGRAAAAERAASLHQVRAELLRDTPESIPSSDGSVTQAKYRVPVRWATPGGGVSQGVALVPEGMERGDRTDIWVDSRGKVTAPPKDDGDVLLEAFAVGAGVTAGSAAAVLVVRLAVRRTADRHRMAEWEREWISVEPKWSGRRRA
ncbi:hypothetical protein OHS70_35150 [Streptomyces sp. NBC_00390]|uniref:Rv1733c family protein n=1 Tax=Streptomyces sp. NBC_00390 TaxID=2975736 RepID=UPI002E1BEDF4